MKDYFKVFIYNNIAKPYISIRTYKKGISKDIFVKEDYLELNEDEIKDGLPTNLDYLNSFILGCDLKDSDLYLVLNLEEIFKITSTMPLINSKKAKKGVDNDIKENYPSLMDNYYNLQTSYKSKDGYIYYNYFIPNTFLSFFTSLISPIEKTFKHYDTFGSFICRINGIKDKEYIYTFVEHSVGTIILNYNGALSFNSCVGSFKELNDVYFNLTSKHIYDLEKHIIDKSYSNTKITGYIGKNVEKILPRKGKFEY